MSAIEEQLAEQLALVSKQIEEHETAIWLLQERRQTLRMQLKAAGFTAPVTPLKEQIPA